MTKAEDNPFPYVTVVEQSSTPATPATGKHKLYTKTDGSFYTLDHAGTEAALGSGSGGGGRAVLIYASGAYPSRPAGGHAEYVGPTQPTTWIAGDTWIKATP